MKQYKPLFALLLFLLLSGKAMAIEEPKFEVILSEGQYEVRRYAPMLIAETLADGDMDEASNKGFRVIADFIFGNNQMADASSEKIAMTAPVTVESQSNNEWRVNFVMPSRYTLETIPKPKNSAVRLKEISSKTFVVLKYSGFNTIAKVEAKTQEAKEWALQKNFKIIGIPQLSRYDPPWTLPMFRRNEIMVEVLSP
jgi:hypothetical protein